MVIADITKQNHFNHWLKVYLSGRAHAESV